MTTTTLAPQSTGIFSTIGRLLHNVLRIADVSTDTVVHTVESADNIALTAKGYSESYRLESSIVVTKAKHEAQLELNKLEQLISASTK